MYFLYNVNIYIILMPYFSLYAVEKERIILGRASASENTKKISAK
jgi:hypothetical protein